MFDAFFNRTSKLFIFYILCRLLSVIFLDVVMDIVLLVMDIVLLVMDIVLLVMDVVLSEFVVFHRLL